MHTDIRFIKSRTIFTASLRFMPSAGIFVLVDREPGALCFRTSTSDSTSVHTARVECEDTVSAGSPGDGNAAVAMRARIPMQTRVRVRGWEKYKGYATTKTKDAAYLSTLVQDAPWRLAAPPAPFCTSRSAQGLVLASLVLTQGPWLPCDF